VISVVVDVDDTLICTDRRMQSVWREVLGRDIPLEAVETLGLEQIFLKYASQEQKARVNEFQRRFWDVVLCLEEVGVESLKLHDPFPSAAEVLQKWNRQCVLVYLTGRTENMRELTLNELKKLNFPIDNTQLVMFNLDDYARARGENPSGPTLVDAKFRLFSSIAKEHHIVRVVDDYPGYFPIYTQFNIPDRIGFLRPKKHSQQHYVERGATRVVESWNQLKDDMPRALT